MFMHGLNEFINYVQAYVSVMYNVHVYCMCVCMSVSVYILTCLK